MCSPPPLTALDSLPICGAITGPTDTALRLPWVPWRSASSSICCRGRSRGSARPSTDSSLR
jgi:hypothetical protein